METKIILRRRQQARLCLVAVFLGVFASGIAALLLRGIGLFTSLFYSQSFSISDAKPDPSHLGLLSIFVPVIGGVIVGFMARYGSAAIRGHGIPEAMEKILLDESRIPMRVLFWKPVSSAIAIGSGGPFGAEGPIIATGGALGSLCGQVLPFFSETERKILLSCGAAAGMTAIFGTPLAAALLAIELLLFEFRQQSFIPVILSSVTAAVIRFSLGFDHPFLEMPAIGAGSMSQMPVYLFSGVLFGICSIGITKSVYLLEDGFEKLPLHWMWSPAIGGLGVGIIGWFMPNTLGVGYDNIQNGLNGSLLAGPALLLCFWKFVSWSIALGSGTSGGTLAPLLTIGSLLGLSLGIVLKGIFPSLDIDIHVMALIGMASVFAGCSRALFASVLFALETTRQPLGAVPLLGACALSYLVSHWFMTNSIMTEKIARRGVKVPADYFPHQETSTRP